MVSRHLKLYVTRAFEPFGEDWAIKITPLSTRYGRWKVSTFERRQNPN